MQRIVILPSIWKKKIIGYVEKRDKIQFFESNLGNLHKQNYEEHRP